MGVPQILVIILYSVSLISTLILQISGTPRKHDFASALFGALLMMVLLAWGGFFK